MVTVRGYVPSDRDAVAELWLVLHRESSPHLADPESALLASFREYLGEQTASGTLLTWVAETNGKVISTASILRYPIPPRQGKTHEGSVINVVTHPAWRRKGIASEVMRALMDYVETSSLRRVWLRTTMAGRGVYTNVGFVADSTFLFYEPLVRHGR